MHLPAGTPDRATENQFTSPQPGVGPALELLQAAQASVEVLVRSDRGNLPAVWETPGLSLG